VPAFELEEMKWDAIIEIDNLRTGQMTLAKSRDMSCGECRNLVRLYSEGRLAYLSGRGARSVVVTYAVTDDQILFLLPYYNEITQYAPGRQVTLVVDDEETASTSPRYDSVRVSGVAHLAGANQASLVRRTNFSESWPQGVSTSIIYLPIGEIEGSKRVLQRSGPPRH